MTTTNCSYFFDVNSRASGVRSIAMMKQLSWILQAPLPKLVGTTEPWVRRLRIGEMVHQLPFVPHVQMGVFEMLD